MNQRLLKLKNFPLILIALSLMGVLFALSLYLKNEYVNNHISFSTKETVNEIERLIKSKRINTDNISLLLSQNDAVIRSIKRGDFRTLQRQSDLLVSSNTMYKNVWMQFIDKDGHSTYRSWSDKKGDDIASVRDDLKVLLRTRHRSSTISVGKFDLTFKGISPIYYKEEFLGFLEVITHFNSISRSLNEINIKSAIVVSKSYKNQLKFAQSQYFIGDYYIANIDLDSEIKALLMKEGIPRLEKIKGFISLEKYYVVCVPIYNIDHDIIAHYLAFIDKENLSDILLFDKNATYFIVLAFLIGLFYSLYLFWLRYKVQRHIVNIEEYNSRLELEVQKQMEAQKMSLYVDKLTGTYKRISFDEDIKKYTSFKLLMINIDNFSNINSSFGFDIGDKVLIAMVQRFKDFNSSKLYRINADEFVLLCDDYIQMIEDIRTHFNNSPLLVEQLQFRITFSFGVYLSEKETVGSLRKVAMALKEAKKLGKNRYVVYQEKVLLDRSKVLEMTQVLLDALEHRNLVPYFQGIYDNRLKKIVKYEALARIVTPDRVYSPFEFLDIAKVGGFTKEVTKTMIDQAIKAIAESNLMISINLTEDDLDSDYLLSYLEYACKNNSVKYSQVSLELLEGVSMRNNTKHIELLSSLKSKGFQLAIDDFGVEYSNFERIAELDVDIIKIDGKYIKVLDTNERYRKIVEAIVYFAKTMNIKTVAEFVHSQAIQDIVEELGIDYSQGYLFSQPKATI